MTKLQELKETLAIRNEARKAEIAEIIETRKVEMQLTKLDSPAFLEREIVKSNNLTLAAIISAFEDLETGSDKAIKPVFGYGAQVSKVLTIVRSVMFAKHDYRESMESIVALDEDLIEETMDNLGAPSYYSMREDKIVDAIDPDLEALKGNLTVIASELGLTDLNMAKLTQSNIDRMYTTAASKAVVLMENTRAYAEDNATDTKYSA